MFCFEVTMPTLSRVEMKKILYLRNAVVDLIEQLQNRDDTATTQGIFRKSGVKKQITQAFKKIMKGEKANDVTGENIHSATGLLKKLLTELSALKQPVISLTYDASFPGSTTNGYEMADANSNLTNGLPIFNYQIICKLHTLMNKISANSNTNMMTVKTISHVLTQILFIHKATKENELLIENFIKSPPPQPLAPACFKRMINSIEDEIKTKTWSTGFAGGVRIDIAGQFKKVPHQVAEIYEIINHKQLTPEAKYSQIKEQAGNAIIKPQLWQKKDTFEFYKKVVNDEYFLSSSQIRH